MVFFKQEKSSSEDEQKIMIKRVRRIELPTTAWKAVVLPLNYTRKKRSGRDLNPRSPA